MAAAEANPDFLDALVGAEMASHVRDLPGIDDALRSGSRAKTHRALQAVRGKAGSIEVNEAIERAVAYRRNFTDPIASAPAMHTVNGIGTRLAGRDEVLPRDPTYVKTLFFTLVFLPIWPIASYLVADAGGRAWRFFGRVPLSRFHRMWRRGLLAAVAVVGLSVWLVAHAAASKCEVRFVNGLDVEVTTTVGSETLRLAPGIANTRVIATGSYHLVTKSIAGQVIEELDVDVPRRTDFVAYNALGAAPIFLESVKYAEHKASETEPPQPVPMIGSSWIVREDVEYVFVTPPTQIQSTDVPKPRHHALVLDGGWRASVRFLANLGDAAKAAELAFRVALEERQEDALGFATEVAGVLGGERLLALGDKAVAAMPKSIEAHRARQAGLRMLRRTDEARASYKAAYEKNPGSAAAGYLYARLLPSDEELPILDPLVAAHPDDRWLLRALGASLHDLGRFADAVPPLEHLTRVDQAEGKRMLSYLAESLAGAGRVPEAQRLVRSAITGDDWDLVILHARLARLPGAVAEPFRPNNDVVAIAAGRNDDLGELRAVVCAEARDEKTFNTFETAVRDANQLAALRLAISSFGDLAAAATKAADAPDAVLGSLDNVAALSIACELAGTGRVTAARRVYEANASAKLVGPRFEQLATPAAALDDRSLEPDLASQAVLAYAASRRATEPAEKERFLARARSADVLRIIVPR